MATIRDVARLAGVSTSTVSLTFGARDRVSEQTARRVWSAAEQLGYRPNPLAQSLKRGKSQLIGVVVSDLTNPFFGRLLRHVEERALAAGYYVVVCDSDGHAEREIEIVSRLSAQRVAGILISPHGAGTDYDLLSETLDTPLVVIDQKLPGGTWDFVASDSHLAASILTEHLVQLGHRRIAHLTGPLGIWTASERNRGFIDVLTTAGIAPDPTLIVDGNYTSDPAYEQTMRLLTRRDRPTAIIASNNVMGIGALQAIQELGFDCPCDISLAMIDDIPWSAVIRPRLTMVKQDIRKLAEVSTNYLLDRINDKSEVPPPARETILTPRLVMGTSTAPPPS